MSWEAILLAVLLCKVVIAVSNSCDNFLRNASFVFGVHCIED